MALAATIAIAVGGWAWWQQRRRWPRRVALRGIATSTRPINVLGLVGGVLLAAAFATPLAAGVRAGGAATAWLVDAAPLTVVGAGVGAFELGRRGLGLSKTALCPRLGHFPLALLLPLTVAVAWPLVAALPAAKAAPATAPAPTWVQACTAGVGKAVPGWTAEQLGTAATIVAAGREMRLPPRAQLVAIATAMQESTLHNWPGGDRDSAGAFQQRPSQGWGTYAQVTDLRFAARTFYTRLLAIPGWDRLPVTVAAQAVQRSAYPVAYAKWEGPAGAVLAAVSVTCTNPK